MEAIAAHAPNNPITDVVSVKGEVKAAVERAGLSVKFVGGHPMTGTSASGWAVGDADLFVDAVWVVATDDGVDAQVWSQVAELALDCGSVVVPPNLSSTIEQSHVSRTCLTCWRKHSRSRELPAANWHSGWLPDHFATALA
ncbi:hypothetical protein GCM10020255_044300 [Rhodococcus baikonurensis]